MSFLICGSGTTTVLNNAIIDDIIQDKMGWTDKPLHKNSTDSSSSDQKERCIAHQRLLFKKNVCKDSAGNINCMEEVFSCFYVMLKGRIVPGVMAEHQEV